MLVALLAFCAGAVTSVVVLRATMRRAAAQEMLEELSDRRWRAILDAAGYHTGHAVARRAAARFAEELARESEAPRTATATLTPTELPAVSHRTPRLPFGLSFRVRE